MLGNQELPLLATANSEEVLLGRLTECVRYLLVHDRQRLFAAAYRMDISEDLLQQALHSGTTDTVALNIAALMIQREKQKLVMRKRYQQQNNLLADD